MVTLKIWKQEKSTSATLRYDMQCSGVWLSRAFKEAVLVPLRGQLELGSMKVDVSSLLIRSRL